MNGGERLTVVTGGPGSGKTSLINGLRAAGLTCIDEGGRAIIRDQVAIGGVALHTGDQRLFAEVMLAWEMRSFHDALAYDHVVVLDRGVPDLVGYHLLLGRAVPDHVNRAAETFRYAPQVFVAPPWPEIYSHDDERHQDFDEAVRTHDAMVEAYTRHGYQLITLPKADVSTRVEFVRARLPV